MCHRSLATARLGYSEVTCQKNDSRGHFKGKVTLPAGVNKGGVIESHPWDVGPNMVAVMARKGSRAGLGRIDDWSSDWSSSIFGPKTGALWVFP